MTTTPPIEELVKRLRAAEKYYLQYNFHEMAKRCREAADALEAQAARVRELEKDVKIKTETGGLLAAAHLQNRARIAELEAKVEAFREALNRWQEWWELPWEDKRPDMADRCYMRGKNALMSALRKTEAKLDPRDPDPSRPGIFRDHNCSRCRSGEKACVEGNPRQCSWPIARND